MVKHYLGPSRNLTIERLEAAAHALGASRDLVSPLSRPPQGFPGAHACFDNAGARAFSLAPKLHPPRLRPFLIARDRLLSLLDTGLEQKLTLACAPAGFGKTTLIRQWIDARAHQLGAIAWVSLEAEDNDPIRFWRYVLTACQVFRSDLGRSALALFSAELMPFAQPSFKTILTLFLNEAIQLEQQHILVLEDYHVITEPSIHEAVTFLVDHLPSSLHLVLITRSEPALPLVRWRASGDLCEVQAHDLRFSAEEVQLFLQQALSFPLAPEMSRYLETHLEGWATGLHLLALAFQGHSQPHEVEHVLTTFTGGHRYVLHYFVDEVLAAQPEPLQTFLLQTSLLSRLTASLCDAVTGRDDSEHLLEVVERSGLFLLPLEGTGSWYRYHALFAEAMRAEARRRLGTDALGACLDRASRWYEQQECSQKRLKPPLRHTTPCAPQTSLSARLGCRSHKRHRRCIPCAAGLGR